MIRFGNCEKSIHVDLKTESGLLQLEAEGVNVDALRKDLKKKKDAHARGTRIRK